MIDDTFHTEFANAVSELNEVRRSLSITRTQHDGELNENYYSEQLTELFRNQNKSFSVISNLITLLRDVEEFTNTLKAMKQNPQTADLWNSLETAMEIIK